MRYVQAANVHPQTLAVRQQLVVSANALCGAFNGSATCAGSGFGDCCSQFGICGSTALHCGGACQAGYGTCGLPQPKTTWSAAGCYTDQTSARALPTSFNLAGLTPDKCQAACAAQGFRLAGLEFGTQCFCGAALQNGAAPAGPGSCNLACAGDATQVCGGANALSLYEVTPSWQSLGCYADKDTARTLGSSVGVAGNTVGKCQAACAAAAFTYAGMEFGSQCFCGNAILNNAAPLLVGCDKPCPGNAAETCGGANALSLYVLQ